MHVLIAGCGWLGVEIARFLRARGDRVSGVRRSASAAEELRSRGIEPIVADLAHPGSEAALPPDLDAVISCVSADGDDEESYRRAYLVANGMLLEALRRRGSRVFVYTGSTGVFGQSDGSEVDERTPPAPSSPTARILTEAERRIGEAARSGIDARIVRLTGLYGAGRLGVVERVRHGSLALGAGDDVWMNWCHLEDAAATVVAALDRGRRGEVYHGTDALPVRRRDVIAWIAARIGTEPARREAAGEAAKGRRGANRRVSGLRTREELGLVLRYPTFREGLAALVPAREEDGG